MPELVYQFDKPARNFEESRQLRGIWIESSNEKLTTVGGVETSFYPLIESYLARLKNGPKGTELLEKTYTLLNTYESANPNKSIYIIFDKDNPAFSHPTHTTHLLNQLKAQGKELTPHNVNDEAFLFASRPFRDQKAASAGTSAIISLRQRPTHGLEDGAPPNSHLIPDSGTFASFIHEMLHAKRMLKGRMTMSTSVTPDGLSDEEFRTVGLRQWANKRLTENSLREEQGMLHRNAYSYEGDDVFAESVRFELDESCSVCTPPDATSSKSKSSSLVSLKEVFDRFISNPDKPTPSTANGQMAPDEQLAAEDPIESLTEHPVASNAKILMQSALQKLSQSLKNTADSEGWSVKNISDVHADEHSKQVVVTVEDQAGKPHTVNISNEELTKEFKGTVTGMLEEAQQAHASGTVAGLSKALGIYATLKGVMDLFKSLANGEQFDGQMLGGALMSAWGLSEIAGLNKAITDKLGDAVRLALLNDSTSAIEAGYAGGLEALIGQSLSKMGQLAGMSAEAAGMLGSIGSKIPFAALALGSYAIYTDVELLKQLQASGASQSQIDQAIAATVLDSISTFCYSAAAFAGPEAEAILIAVGSIANFVRSWMNHDGSLPNFTGILPVDFTHAFLNNLRSVYGDGSYEATEKFVNGMANMFDGNNPAFNQFASISTSNDHKVLSFVVVQNPKDKNSHLTKASSYYGNQNVVLDDHGNITINYLAPHHKHDFSSFYGRYPGSQSGKYGPGEDSLIIMGVSVSALAHIYRSQYWTDDPARYYWDSFHDVKLWGGDHLKQFWYTYERVFTITGNSHDNTFISPYRDATTPYYYNVYGGAGDDTLVVSRYGQYYYEGGSDGKLGDWLSSVGIEAASLPKDHLLYLTLVPASFGAIGVIADASTIDTNSAKALSNLNVKLSSVENLYGSNKDEVFQGNDQNNIIVSGGGADVMITSAGADTYHINSNSTVFFQAGKTGNGKTGANKTAANKTDRDTIFLTDLSYADLLLIKDPAKNAWAIGSKVELQGWRGEQYFLSFASSALFENMDFVTKDGYRLRYFAEADHSYQQWVTYISPSSVHGAIGAEIAGSYSLKTSNYADNTVFTTPNDGIAILDVTMPRIDSWMDFLKSEWSSLAGNSVLTYGDRYENRRLNIAAAAKYEKIIFTGNNNAWSVQITKPAATGSMLSASTSVLIETADVRYSLEHGALKGIQLKHGQLFSLQYSEAMLNLPGFDELHTTSINIIGSDGDDFIMPWSRNERPHSNADAGSTLVPLDLYLTIHSGAGNDQVNGGDAKDVLDGGTGNDMLWAYAGNDILHGGAGDDKLWGGGGDDLLYGGLDHDKLYGEDGNDTLYGGEGDDLLEGGVGNDTLHGEAGNDTLLGGDGNDTLIVSSGKNMLDGGKDIDTAIYNTNSGVRIDLKVGIDMASLNSVLNIENLTGSMHNDILIGNEEANVLEGRAGNDTLQGGEGNDSLYGGVGDDLLMESDGKNYLHGGDGFDSVIFDGHRGVQALMINRDGSVSTPKGVTLGSRVNALVEIEKLTGTLYNDILVGNDLSNRIEGRDGNDILSGGMGGLDTLVGGAGCDNYILSLGSRSILDASGNGDSLDTITLDEEDLDSLLFARKGNDLFMMGKGGTQVLLTDWFMGETHYQVRMNNDYLDRGDLMANVEDWLKYAPNQGVIG